MATKPIHQYGVQTEYTSNNQKTPYKQRKAPTNMLVSSGKQKLNRSD